MTKPPIQEIQAPALAEAEIRLHLLREDLNHPSIQGNKYHKLKYNLQAAQARGQRCLLTFGGAFSNHIYATAAAGLAFGFETIGIIRGERSATPNPTLAYAESCGMRLHFISRSDYRLKTQPEFIEELHRLFGDFQLIPEGGTNDLAIQGCEDWAKKILRRTDFDYCTLPVGTGGSIAGLIKGFDGKSRILGFSSLKGNFLPNEIRHLLKDEEGTRYPNWDIITNYHFGGYARHRPELISFINHFTETQAIPLDPVYTGKMMYGIFDLAKQGYFPKGSRILSIHTGGLQGVKGFNQRYGNLLREI